MIGVTSIGVATVTKAVIINKALLIKLGVGAAGTAVEFFGLKQFYDDYKEVKRIEENGRIADVKVLRERYRNELLKTVAAIEANINKQLKKKKHAKKDEKIEKINDEIKRLMTAYEDILEEVKRLNELD